MPDLKQRLEFEKQVLEQGGKKFKVNKVRAPLYPTALEIQYRRQFRDIAEGLTRIVKETLFPVLPALVSEANAERRVDEYQDTLQEIINTIREEYNDEFPEEQIRFLASDQANKLSNFNRNQLTRIISNSLGVDVFYSEPWLVTEAQGFVNQNVALINSVRDDHLKDLEVLVNNNIQSGQTIDTITKEIKTKYRDDLENKPKNRAELIARDQTGKFYGNLNQLRQRELGIDEYIWRTARDERVRPSHREKEGKTFKWSEPPADTGHPGQDFQCRCTAEPKLDSILPEGVLS
jgi:SPP1 gp7 family putative phage head morphogenesis protein